MLTRLKVSGFKNLMGVDIRFGPFTCIAGANGVGKSNLFDAIKFLSVLADRPLIDAALSVRDEGRRTSDVRNLFHRAGNAYANEISFEAEMIVPNEGLDDLGQQANASITFLRYLLSLSYRIDDSSKSIGSLEIVKEELSHINIGDSKSHLLFDHKTAWRKSSIRGERRVPYLISTENEGSSRVIKRHQDGGTSGRPLSLSATNLPRTVLSAANAAESPTALLAKREMQSWRLLQLEPSSLRQPDKFTDPAQLGTDGLHLPATLSRLSNHVNGNAEHLYGQVATRLSELIDDVHEVRIDRDEQRQLLTLQVTDRSGTTYPAQALSDGTLRFLALAVLELDPESQGVLCLEEPENGIHPERIPSMLKLLQDITTDTDVAIGIDNPLRQVIINTHSPAVIAQVPDDSLLVAELKETVSGGQRFNRVIFSCLQDTWRTNAVEEINTASRGKLLAYLNPILPTDTYDDYDEKRSGTKRPHRKTHRVIDRPDLQDLLPLFGEE